MGGEEEKEKDEEEKDREKEEDIMVQILSVPEKLMCRRLSPRLMERLGGGGTFKR